MYSAVLKCTIKCFLRYFLSVRSLRIHLLKSMQELQRACACHSQQILVLWKTWFEITFEGLSKWGIRQHSQCFISNTIWSVTKYVNIWLTERCSIPCFILKSFLPFAPPSMKVISFWSFKMGKTQCKDV